MKKTVFLLLICFLSISFFIGCSDNALSIELPHGYQLRSDVRGAYISGRSISRYPAVGKIIGFMLNPEYFYGWNTQNCQFFILNLVTGSISTFDNYNSYNKALQKLNITAPDMDQELTTAAILSREIGEINKLLRATGMKIERIGYKKYRIIPQYGSTEKNKNR